jgi:hypothetical protein
LLVKKGFITEFFQIILTSIISEDWLQIIYNVAKRAARNKGIKRLIVTDN